MDDGPAARKAKAQVARARAGDGPVASARHYAAWAPTYDHEVFEVLGFTGSDRIADLLAAYLPDRTEPVIDLGCGTGVVGARLALHGFNCIDGVDLSPEMLAVAAGKGHYRHLAVADLTQPGAVDLGGYAASVSAGTFTSGHVGPDAVAPLLAAHRAGAVLAWVIGTAVWPEFAPVLNETALQVLSAEEEPIRRGGPPEGVMLVALRRP